MAVALSSDGKEVVTGSEDGMVEVLDASTGDMKRKLEGHTNAVWSVVFSSDVDAHRLCFS